MGEIAEMVEIVCQFARSFGAPYTQLYNESEISCFMEGLKCVELYKHGVSLLSHDLKCMGRWYFVLRLSLRSYKPKFTRKYMFE